MSGQGNAGERGGMAGNLIVGLQVKPHEFFRREDSNIVYDLKVNFAQAALGADVTIPTLYGDAPLKVPAGSQAGEVFTLKGKGIPHFRRSGKGDQLVQACCGDAREAHQGTEAPLRRAGRELRGQKEEERSGIDLYLPIGIKEAVREKRGLLFFMNRWSV